MTDLMTSATVEVRKDWGRDLPGHHDAFKAGYQDAKSEAKRYRDSAEEARAKGAEADRKGDAVLGTDEESFHRGRAAGFMHHAKTHATSKTPGPTKFAKGANHAAGHKGTKIGAMVKNDDKYTWGREMSSATVHVRKDWGRDLPGRRGLAGNLRLAAAHAFSHPEGHADPDRPGEIMKPTDVAHHAKGLERAAGMVEKGASPDDIEKSAMKSKEDAERRSMMGAAQALRPIWRGEVSAQVAHEAYEALHNDPESHQYDPSPPHPKMGNSGDHAHLRPPDARAHEVAAREHAKLANAEARQAKMGMTQADVRRHAANAATSAGIARGHANSDPSNPRTQQHAAAAEESAKWAQEAVDNLKNWAVPRPPSPGSR